MTTQYTQGKVLDRGKYGFAVRWTHVKPYAYESSMPDKETATLSVAAPGLLAALELIQHELQGGPYEMAVNAAITAAKGE